MTPTILPRTTFTQFSDKKISMEKVPAFQIWNRMADDNNQGLKMSPHVTSIDKKGNNNSFVTVGIEDSIVEEMAIDPNKYSFYLMVIDKKEYRKTEEMIKSEMQTQQH